MRPTDMLFMVGHAYNSHTSYLESQNVLRATTRFITGDHQLTMNLAGTADRYNHSPRTLLDFANYSDGRITLTTVWHEKQTDTEAHHAKIFYAIDRQVENPAEFNDSQFNLKYGQQRGY